MPLSKQHKLQTHDRIVTAAGRLFRRNGAAGASVTAVMAEAGLTHGGFYAHFDSKDALLAEVLTHDHGFIRLLARRDPQPPSRWAARTARVFADYLHPDHLGEVAPGCSFAALTGDAARAAEPVREGYRAAWQRLLGEVLRGPGQGAEQALRVAPPAQRDAAAALVALAVGSVAIAAVLAPHTPSAALLRGAGREARRMLGALNSSQSAVSARSPGKPS